jgi:hypothetical protein
LRDKGFEAAAIEGAKSQYDVVFDGQLVFSKQEARRWPDAGEVLALLSAR